MSLGGKAVLGDILHMQMTNYRLVAPNQVADKSYIYFVMINRCGETHVMREI